MSPSGKGYIEYEVTFVSIEPLPGQARNRKLRWTLWRRYSEFYALDQALRKQYGHAMAHIELPPKQWTGNLEPAFIRTRQGLLLRYIAKVLEVPGAIDFGTSRGSDALGAFLEWESRVEKSGSGVASASGLSAAPSSAIAAPVTAGASSLQQQRRAIVAARDIESPAGWTTAPVGLKNPPQQQFPPATSMKPVTSPVAAPAAAAPSTASPRAAAAAPSPVAAATSPRPPAPAPAPSASAPSAAATAAAAAAAGAPAPDAGRASLLDSIKLGKSLKKAVTVDKTKLRR